MKKFHGFSIILIIPFIVLVFAIAGVFAYKFYNDRVKTKTPEELSVEKTMPSLQGAGEKPATGYGNVKGPTPIATLTLPNGNQGGTVSGQIDLETLLSETDDAGEGDLNSLDASVAAL
jgi:hypothetical protein